MLLAGLATAEDAPPSWKMGLRLQLWVQGVEGGAPDGGSTSDFMVRRAYFYVTGKVLPTVSAFAHVAADRVGQTGLDNPGLGLGTGIALRDGWIAWEPDPAFRVQLGRMYVPFTRAFGTESTFALLGVDLPYTQGGERGALFYASKVGRDDGLVVWGTPFGGILKYRLGIMEGIETTANPSDSLRLAGRVSLNLLEPETAWFNRGTYLGDNKVLSIGLGFDTQPDLRLDAASPATTDTRAWTADVFFDHPLGGGAVTVEASWTEVDTLTQALPLASLRVGDDAELRYVAGGYLIPGALGPGRLQAFLRWEEAGGTSGSTVSTPVLGLNYFIRGHDLKASFDWARIDPDEGTATDVATLQFQISF
jgi:hypothetical protein